MKIIDRIFITMGRLSSLVIGGSGGAGGTAGATPAEAAQIAQNTADIAVNATAAANAATDASTAAAAAVTNATAIAANVAAISANDTDIGDNAADIMANATAITANATAAANAAAAAATAASDAATNASAISLNAAEIEFAKGYQTIEPAGAYTTTAPDLSSDKPRYIRAGAAFTLASGTGTSANLGRSLFVRNISGADLTVSYAAPVTVSGSVTISSNETLGLVCVGVDEFDATGGK